MSRILIVGQSKSGTTALTDALSLRGEIEVVFEPWDLCKVRLGNRPDLVVKKLLDGLRPREFQTFSDYERTILIVRDPRDRLLSWMLYDIYGRADSADYSRISNQWVELIRAKESDPASMSMCGLLHKYWELTGVNLATGAHTSNVRLSKFVEHDDTAGFELIRYEDMIAGDLDSLAGYVGADIEIGSVQERWKRVMRSARSDEWRHWFHPCDIDVFRPMFGANLERFGYGDDWCLAAEPRIDPAHASGYVDRIIQEGLEAQAPA